MICFGLALIGLGFVPPILGLFLLTAGSCGLFLSGTTAVFQASIVDSFPVNVRTSAIGFVLGVGRIGSGLGPFVAGILFAAGASRSTSHSFLRCSRWRPAC